MECTQIEVNVGKGGTLKREIKIQKHLKKKSTI